MLLSLLSCVFFVLFFGTVFTAEFFSNSKVNGVELSKKQSFCSPPPSISLPLRKSALSDLLVNSPPLTPKTEPEHVPSLKLKIHQSSYLKKGSSDMYGPVNSYYSFLRVKSPIAREDFLQAFLKKDPSISEPFEVKVESDDEAVAARSDSDDADRGVFDMDD